MNLNDTQLQAIHHHKGPMLVCAGPGSGKTAVITRRILCLTEQYRINPSAILTVTFTRAAAQEMKSRYLKMTGKDHTDVCFGTFHSIFYGILRQRYRGLTPGIITDSVKLKLLRREVKNLPVPYDQRDLILENVLNEISTLKNNRISTEAFHSGIVSDDIFREIHRIYHNVLQSENLMDYDDILIRTGDLLKSEPETLSHLRRKFTFFLIDEFQDINPLQFEIIQMLAAPFHNLFAVGDDDQSIYGFRGALPDSMQQFLENYPGCSFLILDINYRSSEKITVPALRLIEHNEKRIPKQILSSSAHDLHFEENSVFRTDCYENEAEEYSHVIDQVLYFRAKGMKLSEMAILARSRQNLVFPARLLTNRNIPFRTKEKAGNFTDHFIVKDLCAYLKAAEGVSDYEDLLRIINRPERGISRYSLAGLQNENALCMLRTAAVRNPSEAPQFEDLIRHLEFLKRLTPPAALTYILKAAGYGRFLTEWAEENRIRYSDLYEVTEKLKQMAAPCTSNRLFLEFLDRQSKDSLHRPDQNQDALNLLTMHASKGLEFTVVFLPDLNHNTIPSSHSKSPEALCEERRLLYVAMTRARQILLMSWVKELDGKKASPSRFLKELS